MSRSSHMDRSCPDASSALARFGRAFVRPPLTTRAARGVLVALAVMAGYVGAWAAVAPYAFYRSFPGGGRRWVAVDGPYNEHLIRDVGTLYLALLVVSVGAAVRPTVVTIRMAGAAWLVFSAPHLAYHWSHLGVYDRPDQILNALTLGAPVLAALLLCLHRLRER